MFEVKNLSKNFGTRQIFTDFSMSVEENQIVAIAGPSGGGKTTLLRMLAGLESIDGGKVIFEGKELELDKKSILAHSPLGYVFQDFQLFPNLTVLENLTLSPIHMQKRAKSEATEKAQELLATLNLAGFGSVYPFSLSGGQKQRVALARALMVDPQLVGYDEPTSALDPEMTGQVADLILENKKLGITQIVVTHDMAFAEKIADKIVRVGND